MNSKDSSQKNKKNKTGSRFFGFGLFVFTGMMIFFCPGCSRDKKPVGQEELFVKPIAESVTPGEVTEPVKAPEPTTPVSASPTSPVEEDSSGSEVMAPTEPAISPTIPASATEQPEKILQKSKTLEEMKSINYGAVSMTGLEGDRYTEDELKELMKPYGAWFGNPGMPREEYLLAMNREWEDCTDYQSQSSFDSGEIKTLDLNESYTYEELVAVMKQLSSLSGVFLYSIGESTEGKTLYALEVDKTTVENPVVIVLTGNVHARETAGTMYIIKELVDLLAKQDTDVIMEYLSKVKLVAVPCVNPDGREGVAFDTENYTYSNGQLWKATSNGTDINRNFPGLSFGQILKGNERVSSWSGSSTALFYPGDYGGSCSETKAMMKLLYHYIVVEKAEILVDYHQRGRVGYAGKPWQTNEAEKRCVALSKDVFSFMNEGRSKKYYYISEEKSYGLRGEGSTVTDYACALAAGALFSPRYGFLVMKKEGEELPLIQVKDLDLISFPEANEAFRTMTIEIGADAGSLGYTKSARKVQAQEYVDYHFDRLLEYLCSYGAELCK